MASAWPASLPEYVLQQGFSETLPDTTIQSSMEAGRPKTRRRYTSNYSVFTVAIAMELAQRVTFEEFYNTTLRGGSLPFTWVHPLHRSPCTMQFRKPVPKFSVNGNKHIVTAAVEIIG